MSNENAALELFNRGKEMSEIGLKLEDCRKKLNELSEDNSMSSPVMLEMESKFDELLLAYMKVEAEAKMNRLSMNYHE